MSGAAARVEEARALGCASRVKEGLPWLRSGMGLVILSKISLLTQLVCNLQTLKSRNVFCAATSPLPPSPTHPPTRTVALRDSAPIPCYSVPMSTPGSSSLTALPTADRTSSSFSSDSETRLLDLLERFPDLFNREVLRRLPPPAPRRARAGGARVAGRCVSQIHLLLRPPAHGSDWKAAEGLQAD